MPMPVSLTHITASLASRRNSISTLPPGSVNLMLLLRRFATIC